MALQSFRKFQTSSTADVESFHSSSSIIESRTATDFSDLFFPCGDQSASAAAKDFHNLSSTFESLLTKLGTNFELEVTSTLLMTVPPVSDEISQEARSHQYNMVLLARGGPLSNFPDV